jgi:hypothetical protein
MTQVVQPTSLEEQVLVFMKAAGQLGEIGFPPFYSELRQNRWYMLFGEKGEMTEYTEGEAHDNLPEVADGLVDMMWVIMGTLYTYVGPECARDLMNEVARANLSKIDGSLAEPDVDDKGKVKKPKGWIEPDIKGILERHGWKMNSTGTPVRV